MMPPSILGFYIDLGVFAMKLAVDHEVDCQTEPFESFGFQLEGSKLEGPVS